MSDVVIGVDEVGLGSIAGPVVAAAVVFPDLGESNSGRVKSPIEGLNDSKKLTHNRRVFLCSKIVDECEYWVIAQSNAPNINRHGIVRCHQACIKAVVRISRQFHDKAKVILDGNTWVPGMGDHTPIVGADSKIPAVSAASIIAKVYRDNLMVNMATGHPRYKWENNKGYGTQEHIAALERYGITPQHRRKYAPVRRVLVGRH